MQGYYSLSQPVDESRNLTSACALRSSVKGANQSSMSRKFSDSLLCICSDIDITFRMVILWWSLLK